MSDQTQIIIGFSIWIVFLLALPIMSLIGVWIMKVQKKPKNLLRENDAGLRLYECNRFQRFLFGRRYAVLVPNKVRPYLTTDFRWAAEYCFAELENDLAAGRRL